MRREPGDYGGLIPGEWQEVGRERVRNFPHRGNPRGGRFSGRGGGERANRGMGIDSGFARLKSAIPAREMALPNPATDPVHATNTNARGLFVAQALE